jgi:fucose 4-O-acetylase-like acetyltransferase
MPRATEESSAAERQPLLPDTSVHVQDSDIRSLSVDVDAVATPKKAEAREVFFDNAKGMTVLAVILGHTMMSYVMMFDVAILRACFIMDGLVAMPAFSFLSGHLSSATLTPRRKVGIAKMLLTFIIYQIFYFLAAQFFVDMHVDAPGVNGGMGAQHKPALPLPVWQQENVSWFLLCLIVWRATLPLFARLRRPIAVSVTIAMLSIFMDAGQNFMPIFGFLPFFIIGHTYSREDLWALHTKANGLVFFALPFAVLFALSVAAGPSLDKMTAGMMDHHGGGGGHDEHHGPPKMGDFGQMGAALLFIIPSSVVEGGFQCLYQQSGQNDMTNQHRRQLGVGVGCYNVGVPLRLIFYCLSMLAVRGWLACIPRRRVPLLTTAGAFSLYGYLLHPFVIWYMPWIQKYVHIAALWAGGQENEAQWVTNAGGCLVVLVFVLFVWLGLSNIVARTLCKTCTEPAIDSLFIEEGSPTPELNKGTAGAEMRRCWECCSCLGCERQKRQLSVTMPEGALPGQALVVEAPWGQRVQIIVPAGATAGGVTEFMV